jgi:transcriptional regulator with XRE-family HTH domain
MYPFMYCVLSDVEGFGYCRLTPGALNGLRYDCICHVDIIANSDCHASQFIPRTDNQGVYGLGMKHRGFSGRLNQAIAAANVAHTQKALGRLFGVAGATAWYYINGEKLPSMAKAIDIAMTLGVSVDWLMTGRGDMKATETLTDQDIEWLRFGRSITTEQRVAFLAIAGVASHPISRTESTGVLEGKPVD